VKQRIWTVHELLSMTHLQYWWTVTCLEIRAFRLLGIDCTEPWEFYHDRFKRQWVLNYTEQPKKGGGLIHLALLLLLLLSSCASPPAEVLDETLFYKRDLLVEIDEVDYEGTAILKKAKSYNMIIKPRSKTALLLIATCHREESFTTSSSGFFKKTNSFEYTYTPQPGKEDGPCVFRITALDKKRSQHSWFFADFKSNTETLPATVYCNGKKQKGTVTVCQSRVGLIQGIEFQEPVSHYPYKGCPMDNPSEYKINLDECVYLFKGKESGRIHRHNSLGYEKIIIREG